MKKKVRQERKVLYLIILCLIILIGIIFGTAIYPGGGNLKQKNLHQLTLDNMTVSLQEQDGVTSAIVQGTLSEDISYRNDIMMYVKYLDVKWYYNEDCVYDNDMIKRNQGAQMLATEGWEYFDCSGWKKGDRICIELTKTYVTLSDSILLRFPNQLTYGSYNDLIHQVHQKNELELCFGFFTLSIGFVIFVSSLLLSLFRIRFMLKGIANGMLIITGALWYLIEAGNDYWELVLGNDLLYNFLDVFIVFLMPVTMTFYFVTLLTDQKRKVWAGRCVILQIIFDIQLLILSLVRKVELFYSQGLVIVLIIIGAVVLGEVLYETWQMKKDKRLISYHHNVLVLLSFTPWCVGGLLEYTNFILHVTSFDDFFQIGILISMLLQLPTMAHEVYVIVTREQELERTRRELVEHRTALMVSQIQPHFIYNSLGTIKRLYDVDHDTAKEALEKFTKYLRMNIHYLDSHDLVSFQMEISCLKNYIYLEKLRFGERIHVEYELNVEHFYLPVLTIQPIVENAITHGITEQKEGGTVKIITRQIKDEVHIYITDDGVGFSQKEVDEDGLEHVGIRNVKSRIENMCYGHLKVASIPGKGTTVEIVLPLLTSPEGN